MAEGLYVSRRYFLTTSGLALAGAVMPAPLEVLAQSPQQQARTYDVEFLLVDKGYGDIQKALRGKQVSDEIRPPGIPSRGTVEEIKAKYRELTVAGFIPDTRSLDQSLENLASRLSSDPNFLNGNLTFNRYAVRQEKGFFLLNYKKEGSMDGVIPLSLLS